MLYLGTTSNMVHLVFKLKNPLIVRKIPVPAPNVPPISRLFYKYHKSGLN